MRKFGPNGPVNCNLDLGATGVSTDAEVRADFEQAFARALRQRGVQAETSYTRVADPEADAEVFVAAARRAGVDSILVTRYVGQRVEEVYHPGYYYYDSMPAYGGVYEPLGDYYGHAWGMAYEQPVWTANRTYTLISDLFAVEGGQHIWQAVSDTVRSGSDRKLRDDIIRSFVSDLRDRGLLN